MLDFGLAKTTEDDGTRTVTEAVVGTPAYMAPEQREGKQSRRALPPARPWARPFVRWPQANVRRKSPDNQLRSPRS